MIAKSILFFVAVAVASGVSLSLTSCSEPVDASAEPFIKAVHYFSDDWPKTFWEDFENSQVRSELEQVRRDGFNTVILVLPWRGFETGFGSGATQPTELYERLDFLLDQVVAAGLDFGLRVGFPHSFDGASGIGIWPLCRAVFTDPDTRENWRSYLGRIAQRIDRHRAAFRFAFFSWEDFFCPYSVMPKLPLEERREIARSSGYQAWLEENHELEQVGFLYSESFGSVDSIPVPERDSPAFWLFIRFIDHFLVQELVLPGREAIPELSMEVRVDKDGVKMNEAYSWVEHDLMLDDPHIRGSYWGPYHGAANNGETLDSTAALRNLEYMLKRVSDNGRNRQHVLEQFNFIDNTPQYAGYHARIDPTQMEAFLGGAAELLKRYAIGYGVWAYRDYPDTVFYNGSFELGLRGWEADGEAHVVTNGDGDRALELAAGATLRQRFPPYDRFAALGLGNFLTFCAHVERVTGPLRLRLAIDDTELQKVTVAADGDHCWSLDVNAIRHPEVEFVISSDKDVRIDDLKLFAFEQNLGIYRRDGSPGFLRDTVVRMNRLWLGSGASGEEAATSRLWKR